MRGATECGRRLKRLFTALRSKRGKVHHPPIGDPITQLVLGVFSRDAPEAKAREALQKLRAMVVDYNELRVVAPIELADASTATDTPKLDPYRTGLPGRPTIKHKILEEFRKRVEMKTFDLKLTSEAEELRKWAEKEHPDAPRPTLGTIENLIRDEHRRAKTLPPNAP